MNLNATLIIEVLSFLILVTLLTKFLYRPILNILDKRSKEVREIKEQIKHNLDSARSEREKAREILDESKNQAKRIKDKITRDAEEAREKIISQAKKEAERILQTSRKDIGSEIKKAREQIKSKLIDLSFEVAEKILRRQIKSKDHERMVEELIEEINSGRDASSR